MGAGHETTASTAAAALWAIAAHPQAEARVHTELDRVLGAFQDQTPQLCVSLACIRRGVLGFGL